MDLKYKLLGGAILVLLMALLVYAFSASAHRGHELENLMQQEQLQRQAEIEKLHTRIDELTQTVAVLQKQRIVLDRKDRVAHDTTREAQARLRDAESSPKQASAEELAGLFSRVRFPLAPLSPIREP